MRSLTLTSKLDNLEINRFISLRDPKLGVITIWRHDFNVYSINLCDLGIKLDFNSYFIFHSIYSHYKLYLYQWEDVQKSWSPRKLLTQFNISFEAEEIIG